MYLVCHATTFTQNLPFFPSLCCWHLFRLLHGSFSYFSMELIFNYFKNGILYFTRLPVDRWQVNFTQENCTGKIPPMGNSTYGKFHLWKIPSMENSTYGKFHLRKIPCMENSNYGKFHLWKIPLMKDFSFLVLLKCFFIFNCFFNSIFKNIHTC